MRFARASLACWILFSLVGCNEIVGARRYHVGDGGGALDASIDASYCDPSERETYYIDEDGDDFGGAGTVVACDLPVGFAAQAGDCNDSVGTAHPGASEVCDDVDSDCDGTIDEGVFGPIGTGVEVIAAGMAGSQYQTSVAAYADGFLVVSGRYARWLDVNGAPTGDAFTHSSEVVGPTAAYVFEGTTPARGVIASSSSLPYGTVNAFSANMRGTALSLLQPLTPPADPPLTEFRDIEIYPIENQLAVLGIYETGDDEGILRGGAINPLTWQEQSGPQIETYLRTLDGAIPITGTNGTLVSVGTVFGVSYGAVFNWMTLDASGNLVWGVEAADLGANMIRGSLPTTNGMAVGTNALFVAEDTGTICLRHVPLGNPGELVTPTPCESAVTWSVADIAMRDGVVSVLAYDGTFQELPFAPGTVGRPAIDAGAGIGAIKLAVRGGHGIVIYTSASALFARPLGCQ